MLLIVVLDLPKYILFHELHFLPFGIDVFSELVDLAVTVLLVRLLSLLKGVVFAEARAIGFLTWGSDGLRHRRSCLGLKHLVIDGLRRDHRLVYDRSYTLQDVTKGSSSLVLIETQWLDAASTLGWRVLLGCSKLAGHSSYDNVLKLH